MPYSTQAHMQSAVSGSTAADRKYLDAVAVANGAPSGDVGVEVNNARYMVATLQAGTDTVSARVWTRDAVSELWTPDNVVYGTFTVETSGRRIWYECPGADRFYIELVSVDPDADATDGTLTAWVGRVHIG